MPIKFKDQSHLCHSKFSFNIRWRELGWGYTWVKSSLTIAIHNNLTGKLCGLLEEWYVRTESPNILVNLQEYFIVFKICTPSTLWTITQRMVRAWGVTGSSWWYDHLINKLLIKLSFLLQCLGPCILFRSQISKKKTPANCSKTSTIRNAWT